MQDHSLQLALAMRGHYPGAIDGILGEGSLAGIRALVAELLPDTGGAVAARPMQGSRLPAYYLSARAMLGIQEVAGPRSNPQILRMIQRFSSRTEDDSQFPWCGAFVGSHVENSGLPLAETPTLARSWLGWGHPVEEPSEGDIAVLWRESPESWKGHVAMFVKREGDQVLLLGGNQSNAVTIQAYPADQVLGYRTWDDLPA